MAARATLQSTSFPPQPTTSAGAKSRGSYSVSLQYSSSLASPPSFSFVFFSRPASADVETIAGEMAALLLFLRHEGAQDGWWLVALWILMALTSQMKGLLGFVLPIAVIGSYWVLADGWAEL